MLVIPIIVPCGQFRVDPGALQKEESDQMREPREAWPHGQGGSNRYIGPWYPPVNIQKAIENGHRNSEFSHKKMVIFHSYVSLPEGMANPLFIDDFPIKT